MTGSMQASEVKAAIHRRHGCDSSSGQWVCVDEAFSGYSAATGGIDTLAIGVWRTAKAPGLSGAGRVVRNAIVAYEVKVSRSDLRRELYGYQPGEGASYRSRPVPKWPGKALWALAHSHYFLFAVPAGLLKPDELDRREPTDDRRLYVPPECGLLEVDGGGCKIRVEAEPRHHPTPFTAHQSAELIRHAIDPSKERQLRAQLGHVEQSNFAYMAVVAAVDATMRDRGHGEQESGAIAHAVMRKLRERT